MTDPRPQFVVGARRKRLLWFLFVLAVLAALWLGFVLYGETQGFGDDPGRWAYLPTFVWAFLAAGFSVLLLVYALALLTIRERPSQVYRLHEDVESPAAEGPQTPSFLQPPESGPAPETPSEPNAAGLRS